MSSSVSNPFINAVHNLNLIYQQQTKDKQEIKKAERKVIELGRELFRTQRRNYEKSPELDNAFKILSTLFPKFPKKVLEPPLKKRKIGSNDDMIFPEQNPSMVIEILSQKLQNQQLSQDEKDQLICNTLRKCPLYDQNMSQYTEIVETHGSILAKQKFSIHQTLSVLWNECCKEKAYTPKQQQEFWLSIEKLQTLHEDYPNYFIYLMHLLQPNESCSYSEDQIFEMLQNCSSNKQVLLHLMRNALFSTPSTPLASRKGKEKKDDLEIPSMFAPQANEEEEDSIQVIDSKGNGTALSLGSAPGQFVFTNSDLGIRLDQFYVNGCMPNWKDIFAMIESLLTGSDLSEIVNFMCALPYCKTPDRIDTYFKRIASRLDEQTQKKIADHLLIHGLVHQLFETLELDNYYAREVLWSDFAAIAENEDQYLIQFFCDILQNYFKIQFDFQQDSPSKEQYIIALKNIWKIACNDEIEEFLRDQDSHQSDCEFAETHLHRLMLVAFLTNWDRALDEFHKKMERMEENQIRECFQIFYSHIPWYLNECANELQKMQAVAQIKEIEDYIAAQKFFTSWCLHSNLYPETIWDVWTIRAKQSNQSVLSIALTHWLQVLSKLDKYSGIDQAQFLQRLRNPDQMRELLQDFVTHYVQEQDLIFTRSLSIQTESSQFEETSIQQTFEAASSQEVEETVHHVRELCKNENLVGLKNLMQQLEIEGRTTLLQIANNCFMEEFPGLVDLYFETLNS